jgi:hypothetical protein
MQRQLHSSVFIPHTISAGSNARLAFIQTVRNFEQATWFVAYVAWQVQAELGLDSESCGDAGMNALAMVFPQQHTCPTSVKLDCDFVKGQCNMIFVGYHSIWY